jgi:hypothetical protein
MEKSGNRHSIAVTSAATSPKTISLATFQYDGGVGAAGDLYTASAAGKSSLALMSDVPDFGAGQCDNYGEWQIYLGSSACDDYGCTGSFCVGANCTNFGDMGVACHPTSWSDCGWNGDTLGLSNGTPMSLKLVHDGGPLAGRTMIQNITCVQH